MVIAFNTIFYSIESRPIGNRVISQILQKKYFTFTKDTHQTQIIRLTAKKDILDSEIGLAIKFNH